MTMMTRNEDESFCSWRKKQPFLLPMKRPRRKRKTKHPIMLVIVMRGEGMTGRKSKNQEVEEEEKKEVAREVELLSPLPPTLP